MDMSRVTLNLDAQTQEKLLALADSLGYPPEMAAIYAIRLVSACVEEGLIEDVPARAWPREAQLLTGTGGKVIAFDAPREKETAENGAGV